MVTVETLIVAVLALASLLQGQSSTAQVMRSNRPLLHVLDRVNEDGGPYIGLVMAFPTEEDALTASGVFVPSSTTPYINLIGRRFNIGKIGNVDVIYVMTGEQTLNAGIAVQVLLDAFNIRGIVHYGIAGSTNDSLSIGDVAILNYVAITDSWNWMEFEPEEGQLPELKFGAYNLPTKGANLLAKVEFAPTQLFSNGRPMKEMFWLPIDPYWFQLATQLQDFELQRCLNESYCLPQAPEVVYGLRGSTANVYLDNSAYRAFLFKTFNISTVDEETAAVVMTALTNDVPCIVFRGISDLAGGESKSNLLSSSLTSLAASNALSVAIEFLRLFDREAAVNHLTGPIASSPVQLSI